MLYLAGQKRSEKIEFLNAGVISYSPTIYYNKIRYLLDAGLKFDEVVVLSDLSDVQDEAIAYFCIDELANSGGIAPSLPTPRPPSPRSPRSPAATRCRKPIRSSRTTSP